MSAASKAARASKRADLGGGWTVEPAAGFTMVQPGVEPQTIAPIRAVALIADGGGFRLVTMAMSESAVEAHAVHISEAEVLALQLAKAHGALEDAARGEVDATGITIRKLCGKCGAQAIVRHPSKPVEMCAACDARFLL